MNTTIRQETASDRSEVFKLLVRAFSREEEAQLTEKLRTGNSFIPELSLVAETGNTLTGYMLFTKVQVLEGENLRFNSLALAPVAVLPEFQKQGIGSALLKYGLEKAACLGYSSVIVLGHPGYYPKFGFKPAGDFGIMAPFDVPEDTLMAIELVKDGLAAVSGTVNYPEEFYSV